MQSGLRNTRSRYLFWGVRVSCFVSISFSSCSTGKLSATADFICTDAEKKTLSNSYSPKQKREIERFGKVTRRQFAAFKAYEGCGKETVVSLPQECGRQLCLLQTLASSPLQTAELLSIAFVSKHELRLVSSITFGHQHIHSFCGCY